MDAKILDCLVELLDLPGSVQRWIGWIYENLADHEPVATCVQLVSLLRQASTILVQYVGVDSGPVTKVPPPSKERYPYFAKSPDGSNVRRQLWTQRFQTV